MSLLLMGCAYTNSGMPSYTTSSEESISTDTQIAVTAPYVSRYMSEISSVTSDENSVFPQLINGAIVKIITSKGALEFKLFPTIAPLAVDNFITQAKEGQYDSVGLGAIGDNHIVQSGYSKRVASIWKVWILQRIQERGSLRKLAHNCII